MTRAVLALPAICLALIACDPPRDAEPENEAPIARLFYPQLARVGEPAQLDARPSSDAEEDSLTFALNPGDGTPASTSPDGQFAHVYETAGTFEVELVVTDAQGASSSVYAELVLVTDDAGCECELGCFEDAVCTPRGCEGFVSSAEDDDAVPADALDCG